MLEEDEPDEDADDDDDDDDGCFQTDQVGGGVGGER